MAEGSPGLRKRVRQRQRQWQQQLLVRGRPPPASSATTSADPVSISSMEHHTVSSPLRVNVVTHNLWLIPFGSPFHLGRRQRCAEYLNSLVSALQLKKKQQHYQPPPPQPQPQQQQSNITTATANTTASACMSTAISHGRDSVSGSISSSDNVLTVIALQEAWAWHTGPLLPIVHAVATLEWWMLRKAGPVSGVIVPGTSPIFARICAYISHVVCMLLHVASLLQTILLWRWLPGTRSLIWDPKPALARALHGVTWSHSSTTSFCKTTTKACCRRTRPKCYNHHHHHHHHHRDHKEEQGGQKEGEDPVDDLATPLKNMEKSPPAFFSSSLLSSWSWSWPTPIVLDGGLLLCASRNADAQGFVPFETVGTEGSAQKGMLWARFGTTAVVNTHMAWVNEDGGKTRAAQAIELRNVVSRLLGDTKLTSDNSDNSSRSSRSRSSSNNDKAGNMQNTSAASSGGGADDGECVRHVVIAGDLNHCLVSQTDPDVPTLGTPSISLRTMYTWVVESLIAGITGIAGSVGEEEGNSTTNGGSNGAAKLQEKKKKKKKKKKNGRAREMETAVAPSVYCGPVLQPHASVDHVLHVLRDEGRFAVERVSSDKPTNQDGTVDHIIVVTHAATHPTTHHQKQQQHYHHPQEASVDTASSNNSDSFARTRVAVHTPCIVHDDPGCLYSDHLAMSVGLDLW